MDAEEYRMKISRDWKNVTDYAREEGYKEGLAEAKAQTIAKIAKSLRESDLAMNVIIEVTRLTEEQINGL
jgi:polysaccharide deacetylase 2 family uncharacterized protein YibQ